MRQIKFRGKSLDSGKWYYGNLFDKDTAGRTHIGTTKKGCLNIDPETVGQFTGLKDKNGVEIYEGDIIEYTYKICEEDDALTYNGAVSFIDGCFCVEDDFDFTLWYAIEVCDEYGGIMVIGNIHDRSATQGDACQSKDPNLLK